MLNRRTQRVFCMKHYCYSIHPLPFLDASPRVFGWGSDLAITGRDGKAGRWEVKLELDIAGVSKRFNKNYKWKHLRRSALVDGGEINLSRVSKLCRNVPAPHRFQRQCPSPPPIKSGSLHPLMQTDDSRYQLRLVVSLDTTIPPWSETQPDYTSFARLLTVISQ